MVCNKKLNTDALSRKKCYHTNFFLARKQNGIRGRKDAVEKIVNIGIV